MLNLIYENVECNKLEMEQIVGCMGLKATSPIASPRARGRRISG
jgi:hypothetical protein